MNYLIAGQATRCENQRARLPAPATWGNRNIYVFDEPVQLLAKAQERHPAGEDAGGEEGNPVC
jgi:hypothetical protein